MILDKKLEVSINLAVSEATRRGHEYITIEHAFYALMFNEDVNEMFANLGIETEDLKRDVEGFLNGDLENISSLKKGQLPQPSLGFQRSLENAVQQVHSAGKELVTGNHFLLSILDEEDSFAAYFLKKHGIEKVDMQSYISHQTETEESDPSSPKENPKNKSYPVLYDLCESLNKKAQAGKLDPLVGREEELQRMFQILCRRKKNNPIIVGEPGVGKSALVEGLVSTIVSKNDDLPKPLQNAEIFSLNIASLMSGTKYRGEFEKKIKLLLEDLKKQDNAILFIDEIHSIIGTGSAGGGSLDISNLLKPALASGELRCIGATTFKEYRRIFEQDGALSRRFQKLQLEEPSPKESLQILKGLAPRYEDFHGLTFSPESLKSAIELSTRYLPDRKLPDKAIDLVDETAASLISKNEKPKKITRFHIEKTLSKITGLAISQIAASERQNLSILASHLKRKIFGQDQAIDTVSDAIILSRSGLQLKEKPLASFLFWGPTGVGKTELAKQLASELAMEFIRFDMSEFMEKHSAAKLIGSPPGYIGYEEGGQLSEKIVSHPFSVVLLDEFEKAHYDIQNIFLQVLDYGFLTDPQGRKADFRNAIIIFTTNAGADQMHTKNIGFETEKTSNAKQVPAAIQEAFKPEFRNRLDDIVGFEPLPEDMVTKVCEKFMEELKLDLAKQKIQLKYTAELLKHLAKKGFDPKFGARPIKRTIDKMVSKPIADQLIRSQKPKKIDIKIKDEKIAVSLK